jgi:mannose-6-phosphate isomerase-like protein (cupin superfamily)
MARSGQTVENAATGERVTFVTTAADSAGAVLVMDDVWTRPDHSTVEHVHPEAEERWEIVAGRAAFRIGSEELQAGPGDVVVALAGTSHRAWNAGDGEVHLRIELRPALRWEEFVERLFRGDEDPLALMREFSREIVLPARQGE